MPFQGDPFRTLGIPPGASVNEIKSAYRRLAKQFHPDAAGDRALPRFLAIKAAYEALVDDQGHLRSTGTGRASTGRSWTTEADRARATRDAYRARRRTSDASDDGARRPGRRSAGAGQPPGAGRPPGASGPAGAGQPRGAGSSAGAGRRGGSSSPDSGETRQRRGPRRATPGSTTYDEAREDPFDPEWAGAGWYGPTLGTYWTINPREYADPRKHGPEYQARARRAAADATDGAGEAAASGAPERPTAPRTDASGTTAWRWSTPDVGATAGQTDPGATDWAAAGWRYGDRAPGPGRPGASRATASSREAAAGGGAAAGVDLEALLANATPGRLHARARGSARGRLLVALVAWPPLGYVVATLLDALTGCASLAATCAEPASLLPVAVQPLLVGALLLAPAIAAPAAFASVAALAMVVPTTFVLSASGVDEGDAAARTVVGVLGAGAYLVGWGWAIASSVRRPRD